MKKYKTIDLARIANLHPNTVRQYERIGFISPVPRRKNGYREYNERHLYQIKICRCIFIYGWLGKEIRRTSIRIIEAMALWDLKKATILTQEYLKLIDNEYKVAKKTANILKRWAEKKKSFISENTYSRKEVAQLIGVTPETLRNWERNELIEVPRIGINKTRVYTDKEIERLRIIYMLRQSKYSISSIFNSLRHYDKGKTSGIVHALNAPELMDDASWISVGDRWIHTLEGAIEGAKTILILIEKATIKKI